MGKKIAVRAAERAATRYVVNESGCHISTYCRERGNYAMVQWKEDGRVHGVPAHRAAFQHYTGEDPAEMEVDHLCHDPKVCSGGDTCPHRPCVKREHLALATSRENALRSNGPSAINARKTHCPKCGGEYSYYSSENASVGRYCLSCRRKATREAQRRYVQRHPDRARASQRRYTAKKESVSVV